MQLSEVCPEKSYVENSIKGAEDKYRITREGLFYTIKESDDSAYFPGRAADIMFRRGEGEMKKIGTFGILHPHVLKNFEITNPTSVLELDLEMIR